MIDNTGMICRFIGSSLEWGLLLHILFFCQESVDTCFGSEEFLKYYRQNTNTIRLPSGTCQQGGTAYFMSLASDFDSAGHITKRSPEGVPLFLKADRDPNPHEGNGI